MRGGLCSLLSGGADGQIAMWDLEATNEDESYSLSESTLQKPLGTVARYSRPSASLYSLQLRFQLIREFTTGLIFHISTE